MVKNSRECPRVRTRGAKAIGFGPLKTFKNTLQNLYNNRNPRPTASAVADIHIHIYKTCCNLCNYEAGSRNKLFFHLRTRHPDHMQELRSLKCELCGAKSDSRNKLFQHIRIYHPGFVPDEP